MSPIELFLIIGQCIDKYHNAIVESPLPTSDHHLIILTLGRGPGHNIQKLKDLKLALREWNKLLAVQRKGRLPKRNSDKIMTVKDWEFLDKTLADKGSGETWRKWIGDCLSSTLAHNDLSINHILFTWKTTWWHQWLVIMDVKLEIDTGIILFRRMFGLDISKDAFARLYALSNHKNQLLLNAGIERMVLGILDRKDTSSKLKSLNERSNNETLEKSLGKNQTKAAVAVAVDITMEKLLERIQTFPIYQMGQSSTASVQLFGQKQPHASPLSGAWAHATPFVNLTAHPIRFYAVACPTISPFRSSAVARAAHCRGTATCKTVKSVLPCKSVSHRHPMVMDNHMFVVSGLTKPRRELFLKLVHPRHSLNRLPMYSKNPPDQLSYSKRHCSVRYVQSLGLISVDGKNLWILDSGATDHLTGLEYGGSIGTAVHSRGLYILDDDASRNSISRTNLLSSYFSTFEHDFIQNNIGFLFLHNHINSHNRLPLSPVTFGVPSRSPPHLGNGGECSSKLVRLHSSTKWSGRTKNRHLSEVVLSLMLSTSLPSYLWGDAILTAAHLISRLPSLILHLQTPLECLKESYPSTRLVSEVSLRVFGCTTYAHNFGPNQTKFTPRAQACVFVGYPLHQRDYKYSPAIQEILCHYGCYILRNLRKEVGSPTSQPPALVQDSKRPQDQGMENPTEPCTNNTMSENHRSDVAVLENVEEKDTGDETEVRTETSNMKLNRHSISNYGSYENLSPQFRAFTASLDSTTIPKNIHIALECLEWKNAVMEEMKALEKNNIWKICALPKGHKPLGCKWVFTLKDKEDGTLDRHKARFTTFVNSQGYSKGHSDHTLFTKVSKIGKIAILIVYVDDIVLSGDDQVEISQLKQRMGMLGCRSADTPIEFNCKLGNSDYQVPVDKEQYQHLVGKLIYLSHSYPLLSFPVSAVGQFIQAPYEEHMEAVKRILRYLKNDTCAKVEYRAMSLGICEEIWLQKVLSDLHQECETPLKLFCDNKAAISIVNNPVQHDRTKHVEIDRHFIKERLDKSICIPYIPSSRQVANVLTKRLLRPNFDFCLSKLGLIDIYVPT
ncbi:reverse transcriptase [Cucumis melo var. makuwa]|uniref:Reverse transcriptase n=1 Tax=Cucumis melo var. makuwa TaxID=1194695 RepID=A0A5A7SYX7_CUCMM|nr:reverse transcriptase [Cucumis melo var. makuwa]